MTISKTATDALLKTIGWLHPEYSGLIGFLELHEDQLVAVGPVIQAAATEGPGAFAAAEKAAPDLAKAIKDLVAASPVASSNPQVASMHAENITRQIVGAAPMTETEQTAWMDRAAASNDSRTGSA